MRNILSRFDRAIDSIEKFLEMSNASSIVLSLYKGDKNRLERKYPFLTFILLESYDEKQPNKYFIKK